MTAAMILVWIAKHWRWLVAGAAVLAIGILVWEIRSTYAERDELKARVAIQAVELSIYRENATTAEKLRLEVQTCLESVAAAQGAADSWSSEYHRILTARAPTRPPAVAPQPTGSTCDDAARQYAAWLVAEVTHAP